MKSCPQPATVNPAVPSAEVVLIHFYALWSPPALHQYCIVEMARQCGNWLDVIQVDVERYCLTAEAMAVQSIPTIVMVCRGRVCRRLVGLTPWPSLQKAVDEAASHLARAHFQPVPPRQTRICPSPASPASPVLSELPIDNTLRPTFH